METLQTSKISLTSGDTWKNNRHPFTDGLKHNRYTEEEVKQAQLSVVHRQALVVHSASNR